MSVASVEPGSTFGSWTVLRAEYLQRYESDRLFVFVRCSCGTERWIMASNYRNGNSPHCGCKRLVYKKHGHTKHGGGKSTEYGAWVHMKTRCLDPKFKYFKHYGGRGIGICDRWVSNFENFLADVGAAPGSSYEIERIDNNGNYEPGNCRWATRKQQMRNTRHNRLLTFNDKTQTVVEWAEEIGMLQNTLENRIFRGWSVERALTEPVNENMRRL